MERESVRDGEAEEPHEVPTAEPPAGVASEDQVEARIDRDLDMTFPASDPPGWVLGVDPDEAGSA